LPEWGVASAAWATPVSADSRSFSRAPHAMLSGLCWHEVRDRQALPPPTFCESKLVFLCSPTSSSSRCRPTSSGSRALQPSRMRQADHGRLRGTRIRSGSCRSRRDAIATRPFGARHETCLSRRRPAACCRPRRAEASLRAQSSDWAMPATQMLRRTLSTLPGSSGTFGKFRYRFTIRASAVLAAGGMTTFRLSRQPGHHSFD